MTKVCTLDIETDSLTPTKVWVVSCRDVSSNEVKRFFDAKALSDYLHAYDVVVSHNGIEFDLSVLKSLWGVEVPKEKIVDTYVLSRLFWYQIPDGHSLEAWGRRLKCYKGTFKGPWSEPSEEMFEYCDQDTLVTKELYLYLDKKIGVFSEASKLETETALMCRAMSEGGFTFDVKRAERIRSLVDKEVERISEEIKSSVPDKIVPIGVVTPTLTAKGTISRTNMRWWNSNDFTCFTPGCSFTRFEWQKFNPESPKQLVELLSKHGWSPVEKTDGRIEAEKSKDPDKLLKYGTEYGWKISENNLSTLPDTAPHYVKSLVRYLMLLSRKRMFDTWFKALYEDGRIHAKFNHIGTWTHRMSHQDPNLGNIAAKKSIKYKTEALNREAVYLGGIFRSLWRASDDCLLVGTDAEGIQLRVLAHYINDEEFINALVSGNKKDGTDPHSVNKRALGEFCRDRDTAKTFIYAWLLGAGIGKIASILGCSNKEAKVSIQNFISRYPGLANLREVIIPSDARRGYFLGLDGRKVVCSSEHLMLAGYLQNGESVIVKKAASLSMKEISKDPTLSSLTRLVNIVHDEMIFEVGPIKDLTRLRRIANVVKQITEECIYRAGVELKTLCPMKGDGKIGKTWLEVH